MPAHIEMTVRVKWKSEEPDSGKCYVCADPIYLKQWRMFYSVQAVLSKEAPEWHPMDVVACDSCHDAIK